ALRSERASIDRFCIAMQSGKTTLVIPMALLQGNFQPPGYFVGRGAGSMDRNRAALLRHLTRAVEVGKLTVEQQVSASKQLDATVREQPYLVNVCAPSLDRIADAHRRDHARLRCVIVLVAAERFRQQHGRWPD